MIRAILQHGRIQALEPLPQSWGEGQELEIEAADTPSVDDGDWCEEMNHLAAQMPVEEWEQLERNLAQIERESKDDMRREMGLP
jgi:hypothetical protein